MEGYKVIWDDGYKFRVHITNNCGVENLEAGGYYFDDFVGDGSGDEIWTR